MLTRWEVGRRAAGRPETGVARTWRQRASRFGQKYKDTPNYQPRQSQAFLLRGVQVQKILSFLFVEPGSSSGNELPCLQLVNAVTSVLQS